MITDQVVPFVFESLGVRGEIICLSGTWQRMLENHEYDQIVQDTLGHAAAATGLIAQSLKFEGSVTLNVQSTGPLRMLVMQCTHRLELRGMASPAPEVTAGSFDELMRSARCAITVDAGERPYQGIVDVQGGSLASSLENYFARSVQVPSHVALISNDDVSAGILLQQMPGEPLDDDDWARLGFLAQTIESRDFQGASAIDLIGKLFPEDDVRVFDRRTVVFRCRCSLKRAEDILQMLGKDDVNDALAEQGQLDVTCEYCGERWRFDAVDVARLFVENVIQGPDKLQ